MPAGFPVDEIVEGPAGNEFLEDERAVGREGGAEQTDNPGVVQSAEHRRLSLREGAGFAPRGRRRRAKRLHRHLQRRRERGFVPRGAMDRAVRALAQEFADPEMRLANETVRPSLRLRDSPTLRLRLRVRRLRDRRESTPGGRGRDPPRGARAAKHHALGVLPVPRGNLAGEHARRLAPRRRDAPRASPPSTTTRRVREERGEGECYGEDDGDDDRESRRRGV